MEICVEIPASDIKDLGVSILSSKSEIATYRGAAGQKLMSRMRRPLQRLKMRKAILRFCSLSSCVCACKCKDIANRHARWFENL